MSEERRVKKNMKIGIFTGTFDPFTIGHQNIAERALPMFDKLVIAVAMSKLKHASEEISKRVEDIKAVFPKECSELVDAEDASKGYRLEVVSYDDLTIDLAHRLGARFLVRGVRSAKDFEYEREQADINKQLGGVETILLFSDPGYSSISSTLVRELRFFGREVDEFIIVAHQHPELHFLVTPIGCGIAGFEAEDIAPLFKKAKEMKNISLPESFWEVIE